jgi:hypothetical protein
VRTGILGEDVGGSGVAMCSLLSLPGPMSHDHDTRGHVVCQRCGAGVTRGGGKSLLGQRDSHMVDGRSMMCDAPWHGPGRGRNHGLECENQLGALQTSVWRAAMTLTLDDTNAHELKSVRLSQNKLFRFPTMLAATCVLRPF